MQYAALQARHSIIFCALALVILTFSEQIAVIDKTVLLIIIASSIAILGVPHGALDTLFAQQYWRLNTLQRWLLFLLSYLALAGLVVGLWLWQPLLFFIGFLSISAMHFADDLPNNTPLVIKILHGGTLIVLPTLFFEAEMVQLFSFFITVKQAVIVVQVLHDLAFVWLAGLAASALWLVNSNIQTSIEIIVAGLLTLFVTPLVAFTLYFCGMHSVRHLLRSHYFLQHVSQKLKLAALIFPTLMVIVVASFCWSLLQTQTLETKLIQLVFVSLAALTLPHMVLLYLSGFTVWKKT